MESRDIIRYIKDILISGYKEEQISLNGINCPFFDGCPDSENFVATVGERMVVYLNLHNHGFNVHLIKEAVIISMESHFEITFSQSMKNRIDQMVSRL